jgi:hypothetical protein
MRLVDLHRDLFLEAEEKENSKDDDSPEPTSVENLSKGDKIKLTSSLGLSSVLLYKTRVGPEVKYVSSGTVVELASSAGPHNCKIKYEGNKYWVKTANCELYREKDRDKKKDDED